MRGFPVGRFYHPATSQSFPAGEDCFPAKLGDNISERTSTSLAGRQNARQDGSTFGWAGQFSAGRVAVGQGQKNKGCRGPEPTVCKPCLPHKMKYFLAFLNQNATCPKFLGGHRAAAASCFSDVRATPLC